MVLESRAVHLKDDRREGSPSRAGGVVTCTLYGHDRWLAGNKSGSSGLFGLSCLFG